MKPIRVDERQVTSFDGTRLSYHVVGEGLPILLGNGLGGSWKAWTHQIAYLSDRYRFISWDYRGLYASGPPSDPNALSVRDQTRDALAVLDAEGVDEAGVFGWSMGVQVALELFRVAPDRVRSLVLLNGVAGRPWESVLDLKVMSRVLPTGIRAIGRAHRLAEAVTRRVVQWPEIVTWAKRLGLAAGTLDEELYHQLASSFSDLDMKTYMKTLELLGEHDAYDVLEQVDVPTLMITGDRDAMTPRRAAERLVRAIPGSELMVVPGGTHYSAIEYPELINLRIEKFLLERGYASGQ